MPGKGVRPHNPINRLPANVFWRQSHSAITVKVVPECCGYIDVAFGSLRGAMLLLGSVSSPCHLSTPAKLCTVHRPSTMPPGQRKRRSRTVHIGKLCLSRFCA